MITIRPERTDDIDTIAEINRQAFGGDAEPNLVAAIRESEHFIAELSLVAEKDGRSVGHIIFSTISVRSEGGDHPVLSLGPMAVLPDLQRQGIGTALVRRGLEECRRLGHSVVVVIGHPEYYPRFGFEQARPHGLACEFEVPDEAFMVLELEPGTLKDITGVVTYPPAFHAAM